MSQYFASKDLFTRKAKVASAEIISLPLSAKGLKGEKLSIDIAWIGPSHPRKVLLLVAGVHGVEGNAGCAVQETIFNDLKDYTIPTDVALVFIHLVNPWGFSFQRRTNSENIDLNRNFLFLNKHFSGAPPLYSAIDSLINPKKWPKLDFFYIHLFYLILRHGYNNLKQALVGGQYEYPQGLWYGGKRQSEESKILSEWIKERFSTVQELMAIDLHTGLGSFEQDCLLFDNNTDKDTLAKMYDLFGERVCLSDPNASISYQTSGGFVESIPHLLPNTQVTAFVHEFGTYGNIKSLKALRYENWWHHYGKATLDHESKTQLLENFFPSDPLWQKRLAERGAEIFFKLLAQ